VGGQCHAPAALLPKKRLGTHCTAGWVGPRAGLEVWEISRPPGSDPRTVQSVASRYMDFAIPASQKCSVDIEYENRTSFKQFRIPKHCLLVAQDLPNNPMLTTSTSHK
jgi:hypothetical protein